MLRKKPYYYELGILSAHIDELDFSSYIKYGFWTTYYIYLDGFEKVTLTTICA
jgi:hypothetical protein